MNQARTATAGQPDALAFQHRGQPVLRGQGLPVADHRLQLGKSQQGVGRQGGRGHVAHLAVASAHPQRGQVAVDLEAGEIARKAPDDEGGVVEGKARPAFHLQLHRPVGLDQLLDSGFQGR